MELRFVRRGGLDECGHLLPIRAKITCISRNLLIKDWITKIHQIQDFNAVLLIKVLMVDVYYFFFREQPF